jgi:phosphoribosylanthranilate isomerase
LVGLFVNADADTIREVTQAVPLGLLQFHGNECPDYCAAHGLPWIKAIRMQPDIDLQAEAQRYRAATGLLLDTYRAGVPGGTGESFDWSMIPQQVPLPLILAGGLHPGNVAQAVRQVRPYAVDVSGGVERSKGVKDAAKISEFMRGVRLGTEKD